MEKLAMKPGVSVDGERAASPAVTPSDGACVFPVTFAQQRLWFLDQLQPGGVSYNVPWSIQIKGALNVDALDRSLNEIVRRHEVLRTTFSVVRGEPMQVVHAFLGLRLLLTDLSREKDPKQSARRCDCRGSPETVELGGRAAGSCAPAAIERGEPHTPSHSAPYQF